MSINRTKKQTTKKDTMNVSSNEHQEELVGAMNDYAADMNDLDQSGLFLIGKVEDRAKLLVTVKGHEVEVITYTIIWGDNRRYYVDDFDPKSYYEVNEHVKLPVYVKAYHKKNGDPGYMLKLQKNESGPQLRGERF